MDSSTYRRRCRACGPAPARLGRPERPSTVRSSRSLDGRAVQVGTVLPSSHGSITYGEGCRGRTAGVMLRRVVYLELT
jgi:hypothetical protein